MRTFLRKLLRGFGRAVLGLRYKITVQGAEKLKGLRGPVLVLPNHPSLIDPIIVITQLGRYLRLRPLVHRGYYDDPAVRLFIGIVDPIVVPNLFLQSSGAREEMDRALDEIVEGLKRGENFLIYPAGKTQQRGVESLGPSRAVSHILTRHPGVTVVLIRTHGMWGSMTSFAPTGALPASGSEQVPRMFRILLSNLIFFMPRRRIRLEVEVADLSSLPDFSRGQINPYLERWYNTGISPKPVFVPYHRLWGPRTFEFPPLQAMGGVDLDRITPQTIEKVGLMIEEKLRRPLTAGEQRPDYLLEQLGFDSLERMTLAMEIEQRFGFHSDYVPVTVGQLWTLAEGVIPSGTASAVRLPRNWAQRAAQSDNRPLSYPGETLLDVLVNQAFPHWNKLVAADDVSGGITYEQLIWKARLLAGTFPKDDTAVGLMLPASVAADVAFFAILFAGKLPVLLNWTTGPAFLRQAVKTMQLKRVVTSRRFLDRSGVKVEGVDYIFLEDAGRSINKVAALKALFALRLGKRSLRGALPQVDPDSHAAVLFTSGSEKAPKAVPISHRNALAGLRAGASAAGMNTNDTMLGFLPPFHSLGLGGTVLLPILGGMRVVHHPDPTDATNLVRKIEAYKPSVVVTAPTFLGHILDQAHGRELDSVRLVITGGEKCPDPILAACQARMPQATLLEGYGITECSATIAMHHSTDRIKRGTVGKPVDGVELLVVDPETKKPLPQERVGLLLVHGPTVFSGYLDYDGPSPFQAIDGKRWYITGDLARMDDEGFVVFEGRLKRFIKYSGEMISLPALEEALAAIYPPEKKGPQVAVEGIETSGGGKHLVLFATIPLSLSEANRILIEAGFSGIMRFDEVRQLEKLPLLGSGKTDHKALRAGIEAR